MIREAEWRGRTDNGRHGGACSSAQSSTRGRGAAPLPQFGAALKACAYDALRERIEQNSAVVGVIGLGYVGLPLALLFAERGYRVVGFDVSQSVVRRLNNGHSHIQDVASSLVRLCLDAGRFAATSDMREVSECDVVIVCVPTPLSKTRDPDVSFVLSAAESVAARLRAGQLVVLESTTYPGTTRELLLPLLEAGGLRVGEDFFVCFSPERVDPGNAVWHTRNTPKVIGGVTPCCLAAGCAIYGRALERLVPVSSPEVAEMTKLLENTFRSINIALVNEMALASERLGVNVWEVIEAAATKPFGFMKFAPGPGIGGHCIPLDPYYLSWKLRTLDFRMRLIEAAGEINNEMPHYVVAKVREALNTRRKSVNRSRILLLGVAYKADVNDVRESPALEIMRVLERQGAVVCYHDPYVPQFSDNGRTWLSVELTEAQLMAADCAVIVTNHSIVDYARVVAHSALVLDTRNVTAALKAPHVLHFTEKPELEPDRSFPMRSVPQVAAAL